MTFGAMGLSCISMVSFVGTARNVLRMRHRLEVLGVDAQAYATEMIDLSTRRNTSVRALEGKNVCLDHSLSLRIPFGSITSSHLR